MATANVEQIEAEQLVFPFTGLTAIQRQQSGIARAQVTLKFPQTTLAATSSGEIKGFRLHGGLPRNFAYVFQSGSIKLGSLDLADVLDQTNGVYFENEMFVQINGTTFSDVFKMINAGTSKIENDLNRRGAAYELLNRDTGIAPTMHHATPGVLNPYQGLYEKVYTPHYVPRIIYRGENGDVTVEVIGVNTVQDPFPGNRYLIAGEMHFLQYDMDQAYNYLIHSPIPVR